MNRLSNPTKDLTERILKEVGFEDLLMGFSLRIRTGPRPMALYSFEEVVGFLNDAHPRIDFIQLENWIHWVMGDEELAEKISIVIRRGLSDMETAARIKELMGERLLQCKTVVSSGT